MSEKQKEFLTTKEVAEKLKVSISTLKYWLARFPEIKQFANIEEKPMRIYYRWYPDAPEKILEFLKKKKRR